MTLENNILIVEDEPGIIDNIVYALQTEGFSTLTSSTYFKALELFKSKKVDLIILDIGLPDKDGFALCRELRKTSNVPIIFLTSRDSEIDRVVGLEIGGDDYVVKPFSPRELAARVKAVLRRTRRSILESSLENGKNPKQTTGSNIPFIIDKNRHIIKYYNKTLELSRYEYEILTLLISRPGWVFSRTRIMETVWQDPGMSFDRTVDTHIKTIRKKLKKIKPDDEPIKTHRGIGYSLEENI